MTQPISLLIVDPRPDARFGLRGMLASQPDFEVVAEAATGTETLELTARLHPEVVLMDLLVAELDGVTAVSWIKTWHPHTVVLVLTIMGRTTEVLRALENGADGYLLKDAPREELFEAIRGAASRS